MDGMSVGMIADPVFRKSPRDMSGAGANAYRPSREPNVAFKVVCAARRK